jgi:hypothetical protein
MDTKPLRGGEPKSLSANLETPTKNNLNDELSESKVNQMKLQNVERKRSRIEENSPENGEKNPKTYAQF